MSPRPPGSRRHAALAAGALVAAAALAGCAKDPCAGKSGVCLAVHVDGNVGRLDGLRSTVSWGDRTVHGDTGTVSPAIELPAQFALLLPDDAAGTLALDVTGVRGGSDVATGAASVTLPASRHAHVDVALVPGGGGDDGGSGGDGGGDDGGGGSVVLDVGPDPTDFGGLAAGAMKTATLTVQNPGADVTLHLQLSGDAYSLLPSGTCQDGVTLAAGASCTVDVQFTAPAAPGVYLGHLVVVDAPASGDARLRGRTTGWVSESLATGSPPNFTAVWGTSADDVWAGANSGALYHRGSDGTWTLTPNVPWTTTGITSVFTPAPGDVYVAAGAYGVYHSADGGGGWIFVSAGDGSERMNQLGGLDAANVLVGGELGTVALGSAAGFTDDRAATSKAIAALFAGSGSSYVLSAAAVYKRFAANDWRVDYSAGANNNISNGCVAGADDYYLVGSNTSTTCGTSCALVFHPAKAAQRSVSGAVLTTCWANGDTDVWVAGNGGVFHSVGNDTFVADTVPAGGPPKAMWGDGIDLFLVGASGTILHRF